MPVFAMRLSILPIDRRSFFSESLRCIRYGCLKFALRKEMKIVRVNLYGNTMMERWIITTQRENRMKRKNNI
jgi:hypothetical protein